MEDHEKDPEEPVDDGVFCRARQLGVPHPDLGEVGALGRPQRSRAQSQDNGSWRHQPPDGVEVGQHVQDVASHGQRNRPLAAESGDHDGRHEHARDDERGVQNGDAARTHPQLLVQTRLQIRHRLEGREQEQEADAHHGHVFNDLVLRHGTLKFGRRSLVRGFGGQFHGISIARRVVLLARHGFWSNPARNKVRDHLRTGLYVVFRDILN